jgi:hypothetical protein
MAEPKRILTTEFDGDDGLIVGFSDGGTGEYLVEELVEEILESRPERERAETEKSPNVRCQVRKSGRVSPKFP